MNKETNAAKLLGRKSWEKRIEGKTPEQIKEMMSNLGKTPKKISRTGRDLTADASL